MQSFTIRQAARINTKMQATSTRPVIQISSRLKANHCVQLKVWKDATFQDMANYAAKIHTNHNIPYREAMHLFVDTMMDIEFCDLHIKEELVCESCHTPHKSLGTEQQ